MYATGDGLFVMSRDGAGKRRVTRGGYHQLPTWSPDGRTIAYDNSLDVFVVDVESTRVRKLTSNPGPDRAAVWSPDGRFIVYLSGPGCRKCFSAESPLELWVMRDDGRDAHRFAQGEGYGPPAWGPA